MRGALSAGPESSIHEAMAEVMTFAEQGLGSDHLGATAASINTGLGAREQALAFWMFDALFLNGLVSTAVCLANFAQLRWPKAERCRSSPV